LLIDFVRLLRPKEWVKNGFVIAPLFFTPDAVNWRNCLSVLLGTLLFCFASSSIYVLNDIRDRDGDRLHPIKSKRPIASGAVSTSRAAVLGALVGITALVGGFLLSARFGLYVLSYILLNVGYSLGLKTIAILDILLIALGFVIRVFAGSVLIAATPSPWIIIATGLVSLFLAAGKRRDDLAQELDVSHRSSLDGYSIAFLDTLISIILGTLIVSYLMYTTSEEVMVRINSRYLYVTSAFVIAGIFRYLQLVMVFGKTGSPTDIVIGDRFILLTLLGWLLAFGYLIYG
jgi:decaprenyl-phosphate phosphoribosyltransferase